MCPSSFRTGWDGKATVTGHQASCGLSALTGHKEIHPIQGSGVKSFVDDLALDRGVILSRAATTLQSIETKPFDWRFVRTITCDSCEDAGLAEASVTITCDSCEGQV